MTSNFRFRTTVSILSLILGGALASTHSLVAQTTVEQLNPYVTTATRTPNSMGTLGTVTNQLSGDESIAFRWARRISGDLPARGKFQSDVLSGRWIAHE